MTEDRRLAALKQLRRATGLTLDVLTDLTEGLPYSSLAILCGNSSTLPKKMNSSVKP